jgi:GGDEF domain-containing protein
VSGYGPIGEHHCWLSPCGQTRTRVSATAHRFYPLGAVNSNPFDGYSRNVRLQFTYCTSSVLERELVRSPKVPMNRDDTQVESRSVPNHASAQPPSLAVTLAWPSKPAGWIAAALVTFVGAYEAWLLVAWAGFTLGGTDNQRVISDLAAIPIGLGAIWFAWRVSRRAGLSPAARRAWGRVAIAEVGYTLGSTLWLWYDVGGQRPFPSFADAAYLTFSPLLFWALLSFPVASRSSTDRWKFWLDTALVLVGSGTLVWYFILRPVIATSEADPLTVGLSLAYPVLDLVLLGGMMSILVRQPKGSSRTALRLFVGGLALFVSADLLFGYLSVQNLYVSGSLVDGVWILGSLLMVLGAHHQYSAAGTPVSVEAISEPPTGLGAWCLPYLAVAAAYGLLVVLMQGQWAEPQGGVLLGAVALTVLVVLRQAGTQQEHAQLYAVACKELALRRELEATLAYQASHDALTGLPNRRLLDERLTTLLGAAGGPRRTFALMLLDLDHFKEVNDTFGHHVGDELLAVVADRLRSFKRRADTAGRIGGDEFAVLLPDMDVATAARAAERLLADTAEPLVLKGGSYPGCREHRHRHLSRARGNSRRASAAR